MSRLVFNFFPTDVLPPQQLPVNGNKTQKQVVTQKVVPYEGTINYNFFPNDLLPPPQLPVAGDMTAETVDEAAPAQKKTVKFKGATLQTEQVHSHRDVSPVVLGSRRLTAFSASRDVPNTF
ncbi:hypothetical protein NE237_003723 [Protea cynaroides]|uniref:Uncharacterized protein n=1 Tax=Protea cynaroides TaxID=273540 RepID=A0A9Q0KHL6_9MAGN|nr:hypothetical protein NE237_003723 [Protea cynaroides]